MKFYLKIQLYAPLIIHPTITSTHPSIITVLNGIKLLKIFEMINTINANKKIRPINDCLILTINANKSNDITMIKTTLSILLFSFILLKMDI